MKTKQEQIEEMKTLLLETYIEWLDKPAEDKKANLYDMEANKLYSAGYRKAEEIRKETAKEIEQFKTSNQNAIDKINELQKEINALQEENRWLDEYVSCTLSAQEFDEEIKQAKIDVLNELKRQAEHCDQWNCEVIPKEYIDELLKEYEKWKSV